MERVLWPMEPVEPRMASRFKRLFPIRVGACVHDKGRVNGRGIAPPLGSPEFFIGAIPRTASWANVLLSLRDCEEAQETSLRLMEVALGVLGSTPESCCASCNGSGTARVMRLRMLRTSGGSTAHTKAWGPPAAERRCGPARLRGRAGSSLSPSLRPSA